MKISLIGTGIYGLAIALSLAKNGNEIWMWTESETLFDEFTKTGKLKSITESDIPKNIHLTLNYEEVMNNTKLIFITCASKYVNKVSLKIKPFYKTSIPICIATKGLEESTEELLSDVIKRVLLTKNIAVISGPTFAIDLINHEPVGLAIGSTNKKTRNIVIKVLASNTLKLRPTKDLLGIQLCGTVKNAIAIAAGILKGLGYSESTQAFLINESIHDIKDIIYYLGGNKKTILSFAGIGDLTLTCTSTKSRNFSFGYIIGSTKDQAKIKEYLAKTTVEGYYAVEVIYKLLKKKNINIPLINVIYDIIYNEENPEVLAKFLIEKE
ncbi:MAG: NAD(P)H-dependent glycerol-3-phosphate dehydrogenase [Bacilli bacterium]